MFQISSLEKISQDRRFKFAYNIILSYIFPIITVGFIILIDDKFIKVLQTTPYSFFILVVVFHTWLKGLKSGIFTLILVSLIVVYFFIPPIKSFEINDQDYIIKTVLFVIQTLILAYITNRLTLTSKKLRISNQEIHENREKLQNIIDNIFTLILVINTEGVILDANNAIKEISFDVNDIVGQKVTSTYPWSYSTEAVKRFKDAIRYVSEGNSYEYDDQIRINSNKKIHVSINMYPIFKKDKIKYIIVSASDITQRKVYELELEKFKQNYYRLINANIIGMFITNEDEQIIEANDAFLRMIQYSRVDLETKSLKVSELISDVENTNFTQSISKEGSIGPLEINFFNRKKIEVPVILSGININDNLKNYLFLVADISERKKVEDRKDEFISIASHELKTPLTTLKGYVQLLDNNIRQRHEETTKFVFKMDSQLLKLTELINDLLDVTKIQSGNITLSKSPFNIIDLIEEIIGEVQPLTNNQPLNILTPSSEIIINADRFRIGQVMTNLLTNAINYSGVGTNINIHVEEGEDFVEIAVEDFGIGIPPEKLNKIFDKFFRVEDPGHDWSQGLGLGLYISSEIIKRHDGKIKVKSEQAKGSVFTFRLPKE